MIWLHEDAPGLTTRYSREHPRLHRMVHMGRELSKNGELQLQATDIHLRDACGFAG